jgi:hypothetical protein
VWGELSERLQKLNSASFTSVKPWLTDRYDNFAIPETRRYRKTDRGSDTPDIVFSAPPRLNILATSSLEWFFANLVTSDSTGGFIPRWLLVQSDIASRSVPTPPPLDSSQVGPLVEQLQTIKELKGEADLSEILALYAEWYEPTRKRFHNQPNPGLAEAYFNRHRGHILKLAAVYEAATSHSLRVTVESWKKAGNRSGG